MPMGSRAYNKAKGATFERDVASFLAQELEDDRIDRRVKGGSKDKGDIGGVRYRGKRVVLEAKNCRTMSLPAWLKEAEIEAGNDSADYWAVVHKRTGVGPANMGETYVTMTLAQYTKMLAN